MKSVPEDWEDWKKAFFDALFSDGPPAEVLDRAIAIKQDHVPPSLFKYKSYCDTSYDQVERDYVWCAAPNRFNDPYDSLLSLALDRAGNALFLARIGSILTILAENNGLTFRAEDVETIRNSSHAIRDLATLALNEGHEPRGIDALASAIEEAAIREIKRLGDGLAVQTREMFRVACFAEVPDNILLWSHYADGHKGLCIEYDLAAADWRTRRAIMPVRYGGLPYDITDMVVSAMLGQAPFNGLLAVRSALTKAAPWAYEREWRLILPALEAAEMANVDAAKTPPVQTWPLRVKAVYLGASTVPEHRDAMSALAERKGIARYEMRLDPMAYALRVCQT